mmetsp:Transcript_637/g.885  ORF Transcript_637/g.885 Transcript_637/m.885 type:complete len:501 (+) Transcript_637:242-1744(+)
MILSGDGQPMGGSVTEIVDFLIDSNDDMYAEMFISASPQVIEPQTVWDITAKRYKSTDNNGRSRILRFIWMWVERALVRDFLHPLSKHVHHERRLYSALLEFLHENLDLQEANKYKLLILRSANLRTKRREQKLKLRSQEYRGVQQHVEVASVLKDVVAPATPSPSPSPSVLPKQKTPLPAKSMRASQVNLNHSPSVVNVQQLPLQGSESQQNNNNVIGPKLEAGKFEFNDLDPVEVAQQLTLIEHDIFKDIQDVEFHNLNWKKEDPKVRRKLAANILRMVERFNTVSFWVATEIVMKTDIKDRVVALKKFISVAEALAQMNNFNGVMEVIAGLNLFAVERLRNTWAQVPSKMEQVVRDLNALMENRGNYKEYRNALKNCKGPCVPYLGVCLRDIIFIEEGNTNFIDKKPEVINFEKIRLTGDVLINQVRKYQLMPYPFDHNEVLQDFLKKLLILPEELLYKHSLICEPNSAASGTNSATASGTSSATSSNSSPSNSNRE